MKFKYFTFFLIFLFLTSCANVKTSKVKHIEEKKYLVTSGFVLIYSPEVFSSGIIIGLIVLWFSVNLSSFSVLKLYLYISKYFEPNLFGLLFFE